MAVDLTTHPCFNPAVKGRHGRVHLPVAPKCNIKCNYCNRKYDCVNESRPGVTSTVLSPVQAVEYMRRVLDKEPRISVAGIAGPGDPFANPDETMATLRRIRAAFPEIILCLSSNGMAIGSYIDELARLEVSHVTITVNGVDPRVTGRVYGWVRDGNILHRGEAAAALLLSRQLEAVRRLKAHGITVKVNYILIPGINDHHVTETAARLKELGVDLFNCMALFPNVDTPFADIPQPDQKQLAAARAAAETYLPQMRHCTRCRADAVGLLDDDRTEEFRGCLSACASLVPDAGSQRPYVAVASMEGLLVNQHLGEAHRLTIWAREGEGYRLVEERVTPEPGTGVKRWLRLARLLNDCHALLVAGIGPKPFDILARSGIQPYETAGLIDEALDALYKGKNPGALRRRKTACAGSGCGSGCV